MKRITIPEKHIKDLFNRACHYLDKVCDDPYTVRWYNNDVFYTGTDARCVSGLDFEEYNKLHNKYYWYVLFGISESFYELGFMLAYDLNPDGRPLLRLYSKQSFLCGDCRA